MRVTCDCDFSFIRYQWRNQATHPKAWYACLFSVYSSLSPSLTSPDFGSKQRQRPLPPSHSAQWQRTAATEYSHKLLLISFVGWFVCAFNLLAFALRWTLMLYWHSNCRLYRLYLSEQSEFLESIDCSSVANCTYFDYAPSYMAV